MKQIKKSNDTTYYIISNNGNERSKQNYSSEANALLHIKMDTRAVEIANDVSEAHELSPIIWIPLKRNRTT